MRVAEYIHPDWGDVFDRISKAFHDYSPNWVEWVKNPEDSEVYLVHVVGRGELSELKNIKKTVIIQQCYFTAKPKLANYPSYWKDALLTISFHNLIDYTNEEFNFYRTPWGADKEIFQRKNWSEARDIKLFTTGHVARSESIDLVFEAVRAIGATMYHTGEDFGWDKRYYKYMPHMTDYELVRLLNRTQYIACLRKVEGFELLGIEGLFCGARPIIFNLPTYDSYREHAYSISTRQNIVKQLIEILSREPAYIDKEEHTEIVQTFDWNVIVPKMFEKIKDSLGGRE